jgi:peroxiredoxin
MVHLPEIFDQFNDEGLVILGFNCIDSKEIALNAIRQFGVTYPTIVDASDAANEVCFDVYGAGYLPLSYIIDRDGKIVDAWFGNHREKGNRAKAALEKTGIK